LSLFPGLLGERKAARVAGHKTYFGGFKCPNGHLSPRRVFDGKCCACIDQTKAREQAAFERGMERGRAPERARKEAEAEVRERLKEEQRAARRAATAKAREDRARERANEKRRATLAKKKAATKRADGLPERAGAPDAAPWD